MCRRQPHHGFALSARLWVQRRERLLRCGLRIVKRFLKLLFLDVVIFTFSGMTLSMFTAPPPSSGLPFFLLPALRPYSLLPNCSSSDLFCMQLPERRSLNIVLGLPPFTDDAVSWLRHYTFQSNHITHGFMNGPNPCQTHYFPLPQLLSFFPMFLSKFHLSVPIPNTVI